MVTGLSPLTCAIPTDVPMINRANTSQCQPGDPLDSRFAIGLTGGIGSGKSTVADLFAARGAALIDTDVIAHDLTNVNGLAIPALRKAFGDSVIRSDGAMDRPAMRSIVFANACARRQLESILHPMIRSEAERAASEMPGAYLLFVVPLLIESNAWRERVSRVLVVDCDEGEQIRRVMQRSGLTREQVEAIISTQASRAERLAAADDVVGNHLGPEALEPQVHRLHEFYQSLARTT